MPFRFASNSDRTAVATANGIVWHYKSSCLDREEDLLLDFHKLHFFCLQAFDVDVVLSLRLFNLLPINDVDVSCPSSPRILHVADEEAGVRLFPKTWRRLMSISRAGLYSICAPKGMIGPAKLSENRASKAVSPSRNMSCTL